MLKGNILIPQININDQEIYVSEWKIENGSFVEKNQSLVDIETSKTVEEILAQESGYIYYLEGNSLYSVGEKIAIILDEKNDMEAKEAFKNKDNKNIEEKLKITDKARRLAEENGIDVSIFETDKIIKEKDVFEYLKKRETKNINIQQLILSAVGNGIKKENMILIIGAGDMAKMMIESISADLSVYIVGCVDNKIEVGTEILGIPVIGKNDEETLMKIKQMGILKVVNSVVGSHFKLETRENVFETLKKCGFELVTIVHPSAYVEPSAYLEEGVFVHAKAYIGSCAKIKFGTIILTGAIISHDCEIKENVYVSPGAVLGGYVVVEKKCLIGMGTTIFAYVKIGEKATIVNGANVFNSVGKGEKIS